MNCSRKYGKPFGDLNKLKTNFFENNDGMLEMADHMAKIFSAQPRRTNCKICGEPLGEPLFHSHGIGYIECSKCGHLNGEFEDTDDFASKVYIQDDYSKNYSSKDREEYNRRLSTIYIPKAEYLQSCMEKEQLADIRLLDIGAGCGYFVAAAKKLGMQASGIEISENQVNYGNTMADETILTHVGLHDSINFIEKTDANVISAIGVLEHLINLQENLDAIGSNHNIQYLYASVPMFSFSCAFEAANQQCYNRHTGGTHTHLFSNSSIRYMAEQMGFEPVYEWRFGSDINDLYRFLTMMLTKSGNSAFASDFSGKFVPLMDELQLILDKSDFSSELHFILKRKQ
ncbi:MAG TPA: methyltransferase domain-containing protein [Lachnospiraceae bacterium]|nr:methyltransferase domain-containing protein [Lachnospiraceae bacterium]